MKIHAAASEIHLRFFIDDDVDTEKPIFDMKDSYDFYCTASINDDGVARVEGVTFTLTHQMMTLLKGSLRSFGARLMTWRHNGKEKKVKL